MNVTLFPGADISSDGGSVTHFFKTSFAWMGCNREKNRKPPKVNQAKEMSSKCHLNTLWPFGLFRCVKLCAGSVT